MWAKKRSSETGASNRQITQHQVVVATTVPAYDSMANPHKVKNKKLKSQHWV
jgi:hypothetical protein